MKLGHCADTSRESLAYPYPGKSAKISSGRGFPAMRNSKKLIARVRPGVELVRAIFAPTSALITLDLPTFDRPKKAISGRPGRGNWAASVADSKNRERTRTLQCPVSGKNLQAQRLGNRIGTSQRHRTGSGKGQGSWTGRVRFSP